MAWRSNGSVTGGGEGSAVHCLKKSMLYALIAVSISDLNFRGHGQERTAYTSTGGNTETRFARGERSTMFDDNSIAAIWEWATKSSLIGEVRLSATQRFKLVTLVRRPREICQYIGVNVWLPLARFLGPFRHGRVYSCCHNGHLSLHHRHCVKQRTYTVKSSPFMIGTTAKATAIYSRPVNPLLMMCGWPIYGIRPAGQTQPAMFFFCPSPLLTPHRLQLSRQFQVENAGKDSLDTLTWNGGINTALFASNSTLPMGNLCVSPLECISHPFLSVFRSLVAKYLQHRRPVNILISL